MTYDGVHLQSSGSCDLLCAEKSTRHKRSTVRHIEISWFRSEYCKDMNIAPRRQDLMMSRALRERKTHLGRATLSNIIGIPGVSYNAARLKFKSFQLLLHCLPEMRVHETFLLLDEEKIPESKLRAASP